MQVRTFPLVSALAREHEVDLISFFEKEELRAYKKDLEKICRNVRLISRDIPSLTQKIVCLPRATPEKVILYWSKRFQAALENQLQQGRYEVIFVVSLAMTLFLPLRNLPHIIVDICDAPSALIKDQANMERGLLKKIYRWADYLKMIVYEKKVLKRPYTFLAASSVDEQILQLRGHHQADIRVLPNAVDLNYFRFAQRTIGPARLLFLGSMRYWPNEHAALHLINKIFPSLKKALPSLVLDIVGRDPSPLLRRAGDKEGINIVGTVPDTRDYYQRASVFVCPLHYGSGIKNKLLEAMAMKVPIVCSSKSINGLPLQDGREILVADQDELFIKKTLSLLENQQLQETLSGKAYEYTIRHHSPEMIAEKVRALVE